MNEELLDNEGFLQDPNLWTEDIARNIAKNQFNIELSNLHMDIIRFVREYYLKWGSVPMVKTIRDKTNVTSEQLDGLFERGKSSARGMICKISGLPKMLCIASGC